MILNNTQIITIKIKVQLNSIDYRSSVQYKKHQPQIGVVMKRTSGAFRRFVCLNESWRLWFLQLKKKKRKTGKRGSGRGDIIKGSMGSVEESMKEDYRAEKEENGRTGG